MIIAAEPYIRLERDSNLLILFGNPLICSAGSLYYLTNITKTEKCKNVLVMLVFDYRLIVLFIGFIHFSF